MNKNLFYCFSIALIFLFSCKNEKNSPPKAEENKVESKYTLSPFSSSPAFANAEISNMKIEGNNFQFDVSNYELGAQTDDAPTKMCANSSKGQHIHLIVDNKPYAAKYVNVFDHEIEDGEHHILAFLSRSYHESIKQEGAFLAEKVNVKNGSLERSEAITDPMVFYSRPKGTYIGEDTKKVMLDFYLTNTAISEDGNFVEANINGEIHKIEKWQPYYIEGLPMGENYISLSLKNKAGDVIETTLNPVKRIFTLKEDPQPKG